MTTDENQKLPDDQAEQSGQAGEPKMPEQPGEPEPAQVTQPAAWLEEAEPAEQAEEPAQTNELEQGEESEPVEERGESPEEAEIPGQAEEAEQAGEPEEGEEPDGQATASRPEEQLQAILEAAKTSRISPGDEDRAAQLLKQTVTGGPKALPATLEAILNLPWSVGVKAVTEVWPETKPAGRARLLNGLAKLDSDTSRRIRLSLARGLHAQDAASALKLIASVCEAMGGAQGGSSTKERQVFANVMLGKAKPWLMNISMTEMKPAEAQKLITPALESCAQAPIFTQIWVLRWICDSGKFDILPPEHVESIGKSINRWQPRWQKEFRKIIPKLPESLEAVLGASRPHGHRGGEAPPVAPAPQPVQERAEAPAGEQPAEEPSESAAGEEPAVATPPAAVQAPPPQQQAPQHRASSRERQQGGAFDLTRTLRDIEAYVVRLRSELQQAQFAARRREPPVERYRGRAQQAGASPEEMEELRRHNQQLEEQNQELRQRIEELTSDHEDRAATLEISDALEQFKTFLGLKLKEDFADYAAISREALNEVVRRHAHEILGRIFAILQAEGVRFDKEG